MMKKEQYFSCNLAYTLSNVMKIIVLYGFHWRGSSKDSLKYIVYCTVLIEVCLFFSTLAFNALIFLANLYNKAHITYQLIISQS
jgi:hypothetical protein